MRHWSEKYVGRPYVPGVYDCAELAREVQKNEFGLEIRVPSERDYAGKQGLAMHRAMAQQVRASVADCAERIAAPYEGCGVLLRQVGSKGYAQHIGVYCVIGREPWVLHAADNKIAQVVLMRVRELSTRNLEIEGFYKWK